MDEDVLLLIDLLMMIAGLSERERELVIRELLLMLQDPRKLH